MTWPFSFHNWLSSFVHSQNTQEPLNSRPMSSFFLSWSLVWGHLFPSSAFSLLFAFPVGFSFTFNCQILPSCNSSFLMSFSVTVGELVGNVTLYSHPFCQPGCHVTPVMVVNQSCSLGLVTKNFGLTFFASLTSSCADPQKSEQSPAPHCPHHDMQVRVNPQGVLALGQPRTGERASAERIRASVVISLMRFIFFFHLSWQDQNPGIVARLQEPGSIPSGGSVPAPATVNGYTMRNHLLKQQIMKRQLMQVQCWVPLWVALLSTSLGRTRLTVLTGMGKSPVSKQKKVTLELLAWVRLGLWWVQDVMPKGSQGQVLLSKSKCRSAH